MKLEMRPVDELVLDSANARGHSDRNLEAIKSSLARFGQQKPIVIDGSGVVRAGNGTLEAARQLGWLELSVVVTELEGTEATAYGIADNRTGELAAWEEETLAALLTSMDEGQILASGFTADELQDVLDEIEGKKSLDQIEEVEELEPPKNAITKPGDLIELGEHRVLCGDSTSEDDVERLMNGHQAEMVFTDPPYGVQYVGTKNSFYKSGERTYKHSKSGESKL